jgi:hypothetical protein
MHAEPFSQLLIQQGVVDEVKDAIGQLLCDSLTHKIFY